MNDADASTTVLPAFVLLAGAWHSQEHADIFCCYDEFNCLVREAAPENWDKVQCRSRRPLWNSPRDNPSSPSFNKQERLYSQIPE